MTATPILLSLVGGLVIGVTNLAWLYLAYYLGFHTSTFAKFQAFMLVWLVMNVALYGFVLAFLRKRTAPWSYFRGLRLGIAATGISAMIAALAQIGYFKVVNPEWPEYLTAKTGERLEQQGAPPEVVSAAVSRAKTQITLENYAIQSAITAFVLGAILSVIFMTFLRKPSIDAEAGSAPS